MSRQQERHIKRYIEKQIEKIPNDVREFIEGDAVNRALPMIHVLYSAALNDLHGFGDKRLSELIMAVNSQYECLKKNNIGPEDLEKVCNDLGIKFI